MAVGELVALKNLGPESAQWLEATGVTTRVELERLGPVRAFLLVKRHGFNPSLNLLYALAGALRDCHWAALPEDERTGLLLELDALEQAAKHDGG